MVSFTEKFEATSVSDQPALVDVERQRRCTETPDDYVAVPIIVPRMSHLSPGNVAQYDLFWLVGLPGPVQHPKYPDKTAREALNIQCGRETVNVQALQSLMMQCSSKAEVSCTA